FYSELFSVKCEAVARERENRRIGQKQPWHVKLVEGIIMFVGLVALVWFPLLILSSWAPNTPYYSNTSMVQIGFNTEYLWSGQTTNHVDSEAAVEDLRAMNVSTLLDSDSRQLIQRFWFDATSDTPWQPVNDGATSNITSLRTTITMARDGKLTAFPIITSSWDYRLDNVTINRFNQIIQNGYGRVAVNVVKKWVSVPTNGQITDAENPPAELLNATIYLTLQSRTVSVNNVTTGLRYWTLTDGADSTTGIKIFSFCTRVPIGFSAALASNGLVGLYLGIVLSIGRFLRLWVSAAISRIWLDDMPTVDKLMTMCEDIFIARQYNDLLLEEHLYNELIQLLRDPIRIIDITKKES
ncbi:hypothetical protein PROFUN_06106, partial [Planoprotostelium fungivorum]